MPMYRVYFVDHSGNVYASENVRHDDEKELIELLSRRNAHGIGAGFDGWEDDRLVHRHRK